MPELHHQNVQRLERHLSELQALVRVIGQINRSLDLDQVLQFSMEGIQRVIGGTFGCFILLEPITRRFVLARAAGLSSQLEQRLGQLLAELGPFLPAGDLETTTILSEAAARIKQVLNADSVDWVTLIPLTAQGRPVGILLLAIEAGHVLAPPSIDVLMSIGEQVGMAIENARLHAAVRESEEWNRAFIENTLDGCWEGDLQGHIIYANDAACRIVEYTREELAGMQLSELSADPDRSRAGYEALHRDGYLIGHLAPVRSKSGQIKMLSITTRLIRDKEGNPYRYQSILRDITEQERLVKMLQRRNQELSTLNAIGTILSYPFDQSRAFHEVCERITAITGMEAAAVCLVDPESGMLRLAAHHGLEPSLLALVGEVSLDDPAARFIAVEGNPIAVNDLTTSAMPGLAGPRAAGYHAGIGIPIRVRGEPSGAIFVGSKVRFNYEPSDIALLANIAERIGMALENAELYTEMQRRVNELDGLAQFSSECSTSLDPKKICELAANWTQRLLRADTCTVRLAEDQAVRLVAKHNQMEGIPSVDSIPMSGMPPPFVLQRTPLVIGDTETSTELTPLARSLVRAAGLRAVLCVPLPVPNLVLGLLNVGHKHPHDWSQREIDLLQTIANETANALYNAQLYQDVLSEQRKVQAIFDSGLSGLYATDAEGCIVMFNRVAERTTGWTLSDVKGKKWVEVFADATSGHEPLIDEALLRKKTVYVPDGRTVRTRYGSILPVAKAVAPLLDENGNVAGAVGAFWDLSREKEAEMDYASFLNEVAHQIRNPLTTVISGLELLENRRLSAERRADARALVKSEAERLKIFSQQFLDHQRTIHAPQAVELGLVDIGPVVQELVDRSRIEHASHVFQFVPPPFSCQVRADPNFLDNILRNLLDNAVIYSPGGSQVTIEVCPIEDGRRVDVAVHDQGMGIPIKDQIHIFEAFYRGGQSDERRFYGHGLGLFIARQMARQMDATIEMESEEKLGSTFHLILRRVA